MIPIYSKVSMSKEKVKNQAYILGKGHKCFASISCMKPKTFINLHVHCICLSCVQILKCDIGVCTHHATILWLVMFILATC